MTFRQFLLNYLSPVYFLLRCCWLFNAFWVPVFTMAILTSMGWTPPMVKLVGLGLGIGCIWIALRPWKIGPSFKDVQNAVDAMHRQLK
jgi:hypothetical protein